MDRFQIYLEYQSMYFMAICTVTGHKIGWAWDIQMIFFIWCGNKNDFGQVLDHTDSLIFQLNRAIQVEFKILQHLIVRISSIEQEIGNSYSFTCAPNYNETSNFAYKTHRNNSSPSSTTSRHVRKRVGREKRREILCSSRCQVVDLALQLVVVSLPATLL